MSIGRLGGHRQDLYGKYHHSGLQKSNEVYHRTRPTAAAYPGLLVSSSPNRVIPKNMTWSPQELWMPCRKVLRVIESSAMMSVDGLERL